MCGCFSNNEELPENTEQEIFKLIRLGSTSFNNSDQLHKDIVMTFYWRFTGNSEFRNEALV